MSLRKIVSLTALVCTLLLTVTSVVLYIVPAGRVAYWSGWRLWLLSKEQWAAVHTNLGVLLLVAVLLHTWLNWTAIVSYLKNRLRQLRIFTPDFAAAAILSCLVVAGTLTGVPPFSSIIELGAAISDRANLRYGEPPYGHAELSPLSTFAERVKLDLDLALERLQAASIVLDGPQQTIEEITARNGVTPRQLDLILRPAVTEAEATLPEDPPGGTGNRTLAQLCEIYRLDQDRIRAVLAERGIEAEADRTLKEIAKANRIDPHEVYAAIYRAARGGPDATPGQSSSRMP